MSPELERFIGKRVVRRTVVEAALAATGVFSAEELHAMTRRRQPRIGRATIYRTLRLLCDQKIFREILLNNGGRVFQRADKSKTVLWICEDCSTINPSPTDEISATLRKLGEKIGVKAVEMAGEIRFRCERMRLHGACRFASQSKMRA